MNLHGPQCLDMSCSIVGLACDDYEIHLSYGVVILRLRTASCTSTLKLGLEGRICEIVYCFLELTMYSLDYKYNLLH